MTIKINHIRHSLAHLMAHAVQDFYPGVKFGIGPVIENGFYYDFDPPQPITSQDLPRIEKKMKELIRKDIKFKGKKVSKPEARKIFRNQPYKLELIKELPGKEVSVYQSGGFLDLCRGGHVKSSREIPADGFKLTKVAGAYWRGNEKNPMLTRIYGAAFGTKKELNEHLKRIEISARRDHRKLGKDLDLFVFADEVGAGLPLLTEKGATLRRILERFVIDQEIKRGYHHVYTPDLAKVRLYEISGHYPYYKDTMYPVMQVDQDKLVLRPMTCPHHFMLYKAKPRSYRELPLKIAEVAKLYRYEKSGELTGLMRVRSFCLADSHIFCRQNQAADVVKEVIDLINFMARNLGLKKGKDYWFRLSLGDRKNKKKYFDDPKSWAKGEKILKYVLENIKVPYVAAKDDAAFYGPKIDIQMKNVQGKEDTAFTVQYDFCLPSRFNLSFVNEKGKGEQPVVIHRSSIGALERTMAFLIEHYGGAFPLWLSPEQVWVIPVGANHREYAQKITEKLTEGDPLSIRAVAKTEAETVAKKIREGELQKIPYLLVVGDKEMKKKTVRVRKRGKGDIGEMPLTKFLEKAKLEEAGKK